MMAEYVGYAILILYLGFLFGFLTTENDER